MKPFTRRFYQFWMLVYAVILTSGLLNPIPDRHFKYPPQILHKGQNTVKLASKEGYLICFTAYFDNTTYLLSPSPEKLKNLIETKRTAFMKTRPDIQLSYHPGIQLIRLTSTPIQRMNCSVTSYGPGIWSESEQELKLTLDWKEQNKDLPDLQCYFIELGDSPEKLRERIVPCAAKKLDAGTRLSKADLTSRDFIYKNIGPSFPAPAINSPAGLVLKKNVEQGHKFDPHDFLLPTSEEEFKAFLNRKL